MFNQFVEYCIDHDEKILETLPIIKEGNELEAILVEFRVLIHLEFIIKNAILKLGPDWSFTIVCGNKNFFFINKIKNSLDLDIRIIKLDVENITREEYSVMLMDSSFYEQFDGTKLLFMQEDSLIFKALDKKFLEYDYIGAPFSNKNVGNGGLSLRTKKIMIEICQKYFDSENEKRSRYAEILRKYKNIIVKKYGNNYFDKPELFYIYKLELELIEDYNITKIMKEKKIGKLPDWQTATEFSVEKYFYKDSFGCHQPWYSVPEIYDWLVHKLKY